MKKQKKVLLGLSGGVDSSVAALLLKKQGYQVIAVFMKNYSTKSKNRDIDIRCWKSEKHSAEKIAAQLDIPLIILDFEKEYRNKVINPMFEDYKKGLTPNPDTLCNKIIKFPLLWKEAKKLKADYIATGHYARIKETKKGFNLLKGKDKTKDQSYFLYQLTQKDLSHILFPNGDYTKKQIRKIAEKNNFHNASRPGTRGICFVGNVDMKRFLKQKIKEKQGIVKNQKGETIGTHPGIMYFTIGQRVGPRLGFIFNKKAKISEKYYIVDKNSKNNILTIAPKNHNLLKKSQIKIIKFNQINPREKIHKSGIKARVRHLGDLISGTLKNNVFKFKKPQKAIAPGQSIVLYHKEKVIGGGEIRT